MTLWELYQQGSRNLAQAGIAEAELDAKVLLLETFQLDMTHFLLDRMKSRQEDERWLENKKTYERRIRSRASHIPLQQILGQAEFMGLPFFVNEHVLIPRQDTETLVELVLAECREPELRLADLCTGSGCIALSLAVKGNFSQVLGTDLSYEALSVARTNSSNLIGGKWIQREQLPEVQFCQGDLFQAIPKGTPPFDVITSNPPYIASAVIETLEPEVKDHEPRMALDGSEDGLFFYRRIARDAGGYLTEGGRIYLEIGYDQGAAVKQLLEEAGFIDVAVHRDLPGLDRVVSGRKPRVQK